MVTKTVTIITGLIGLSIVATFTIGLAISISSGFAGVKGGMPLSIIVGFVLLLALYEFYEAAFKKPSQKINPRSDAEDQNRS